VTLSVSVVLSLVLSLTLTPMMCAHLLRPSKSQHTQSRWLSRLYKRCGELLLAGYRISLQWALAHSRFMLLSLLAVIGLNVYLYGAIPKGFFPQQDTGQLMGFFRADQGTSFDVMLPKLDKFRDALLKDPAIESVTGFIGGRGGGNFSFLMIQLKPISERDASATQVVNRLR